MKLIELISDDGLEFHLAECLRQGQMPIHFLHTGNIAAGNGMIYRFSDDSLAGAAINNLLKQNIHKLVEYLPDELTIVDLNICDAANGHQLVRALPETISPSYLAVDISRQNVDKALRSLSDVDLEKAGIVAFIEDLPAIKEHCQPPALLCLLGNIFSNYEADILLSFLHDQMDSEDLLLFDCHLLPQNNSETKPPAKQNRNVSDCRLNMISNIRPLIRRGMSIDACAFHSEPEPVDLFMDKASKTIKWLDIISDTSVFCGSNYVPFDTGSRIDLGFTYDYTKPQVMNYLSFCGFQEEDSFLSEDGEYLLMLAKAA